MLVPSTLSHLPPGTDESTPTPGAATSGFISSDTGVGPADEKYAMSLFESTAATAIASGALAGESMLP